MLGANWASAFFGPEAHTDGYRSILVYVWLVVPGRNSWRPDVPVENRAQSPLTHPAEVMA
jgi:hypothetical protein